MHESVNTNRLAVSATLHCLAGCAIGEVAGLVIGTMLGWHGLATTLLAFGLAFVSGYALSLLPLLRLNLGFKAALSLVLLADTVSIFTMEIVDNGVMLLIPNSMAHGVVHPIFWLSMAVSLAAAFCVALPVNKYLLGKGKGHALVHKYHHTSRDHDAAAHTHHDHMH